MTAVAEASASPPALRRARDILMQVNARVSGVLLNAVDLRSPDYYYYYEYQGKYGHRYYRDDDLTALEEPAPKRPSIPNAKELVSLRIDRDVLDHFQEGGPGWQDRINEALRKAIGK